MIQLARVTVSPNPETPQASENPETRTDERTNPSVSNDGVGSAFLATVNQSPSPFAAPVLHDGVWIHTSCCES